jgi:putative redox protein
MPTVVVKLAQPEFGFEAIDEAGISIRMDNSIAGGGQGYGVSPMQSLLMALGGCSGVDVVSILKKQRQNLEDLSINIKGEREKGELPAVWKEVHMHFVLTGDIEEGKATQAARLSVDKYCSVAETLRRAGCSITWDIEVLPSSRS